MITHARRASHAAIILDQAAPNAETRIACKLLCLVRSFSCVKAPLTFTLLVITIGQSDTWNESRSISTGKL